VSKIYYNVSRKPEPKKEFFYMPTSPDFHLKIFNRTKNQSSVLLLQKRDYSVNIIGRTARF
jgi:hypothetical protein